MSDVEPLVYKVGYEYRVTRLLEKNHNFRNQFIAYGLIPGAIIRIKNKLFWGRYWVIQTQGYRLGMRASELKRLQLYDINTH